MLLSFEIPTKHLDEFCPLADFQFGLAHLFLKPDFPGAEEYLKWYKTCLLDNSMYELGAPLSTDALLQAAEKAQPMAVIAPDWMDDAEKTRAAAYELSKAKPRSAKWTVGAVVQGKDYFERKQCFLEFRAQKFSPICFPFRSPRDETVDGLLRSGNLHVNHWYHLLGLRDWNELTWNPPGIWSCDTSKPFKGYKITDKECRGQGVIKLHDEMPLTARRLAGWNIAYMRGMTRYTDRQRLYQLQGKRGHK